MKGTFVSILVPALLTISGGAQAVLINFDDQNLTGPGQFAQTTGTPQTLNITTSAGAVSFGGGVILTNTANVPADQSSVYGTSDFAGSLQNPITIIFAQPITNFLVDVINGLTVNDPLTGQPTPIQYKVADNQGHSAIFSLPPNTASGAETIGFAATGTQVTITSLTFAPSLFDFFVDNVRFDLPISCGPDGCSPPPVPEPGTLPVLAAGLASLLWLRQRRHLRV